MELTSDVIYGFTSAFLLSRYDEPKPIPKFHQELWDLGCSPSKFVAIAAPRGHAKSTAITHAYTLANVLFRVRDFVLIVSDTEGQAVQFLGDIKKELQENELLIKTFGINVFVKETESDIIVQFDDGTEFRIIAKGSEQKVRGIKWRSKRPNLIICDDLENDEIVANEERRDKFKRWFDNALIPCGSDSCIFRVVGTILHLDSLLENLMPEIGKSSTIIDGLKSYSKSQVKTWVAVRYRAHDEDFDKILWKEKFTRERLEQERNRYIEKGNPEGYAQEYLNYPIDEASAYFQKQDFKPIENPEEQLEHVVGVDLAISTASGRAWSVFVVGGINSEGILKIVDVHRFRGDSVKIIDTFFMLQELYNPNWFIVEQENIAKSIGPVMDLEMIRRGIFLSIHKITPTEDKIKRAQAIRARFRAGGIEVDTQAAWYNTYFQELLQFPKGAYLDQVDATANIGLELHKLINAPTQKEIDEEEWEREHNIEDLGNDNFGRCIVTGY